jgi:hypothetical protein
MSVDGDDEGEPTCPCKKKLPNTLMLECDECETFWHITCCGLSGLTQQPVNKLIANRWKCPRCFTFPEDIPNEDKPKAEVESTLSKETVTSIISLVNATVMKSLRTFISHDDEAEETDSDNEVNLEPENEDNTTARFETMISKSKKRRLNKNNNNIKKALEEQREEEILIEKKKNNLIVFGMPEAETGDKKEEMMEDFRKLKKAYEGRVELETADITHNTRLGVRGQNPRPRPILITLADQSKKKDLLTKNFELKLKENNQSISVYVSPDLTKKQRAADKVLREELKERKKTEPNLTIRNNKIVPKPFRQGAQETETWASIFT